MKDELQEENERYTRDVRTRAAQLMRDEGLPMFDAMEKAMELIAEERKRAASLRRRIQ